MNYQYLVKAKAALKIRTFYRNVFKKYRHTYSYRNMQYNIDQAVDSFYLIEKSLLRRKPTLERWRLAGWHMANAGKWYYAYSIADDTIVIEDACHELNMHG